MAEHIVTVGPEGELEYAQCIPSRTTAVNNYTNLRPGIGVRDGFDRKDYDYLRPGEEIPTSERGVQIASMDAYEHVGPVKNTIDLMTDLVVQGIDIEHPVKSKEKFLKDWWHNYVNGPERSERICNLVYRAGTAIVKRQLAKIVPPIQGKTSPTEAFIPWRYTVLNPLSVEVLNDDVMDFVDSNDKQYAISLTSSLLGKFQQFLRDPRSYPFLNKIPKDLLLGIKKAISANKPYIPLSNDEIIVVNFKKDDWKTWGTPICKSILKDLNVLNKLKLADLAALDGAVAHIRLWKLGSLEHNISPKRDAFQKFASILMSATSGGVADILWGPAIALEETSTDLYRFLDEKKYIATMKNIYQGLGLPTVLTNYSSGGGFSNSLVEIRVMIQRLRYMRQLLINMWTPELKMVQKAMNFSKPGYLVFDNQFIDDEATMLNILLHASERNLISRELFQKRIQAVPEIEDSRLRNEERRREKGNLPPQADPYHDPSADSKFAQQLLETMVNNGTVEPADILENMLDVDISALTVKKQKQGNTDNKNGNGDNKNLPKGDSGQGRPPGSKDKEKRKTKKVSPAGASTNQERLVSTLVWAENATHIINEFLTPRYLKLKQKTTARQLTAEEFEQLEDLKFAVLSSLKPGCVVDDAAVTKILQDGPTISEEARLLYEAGVSSSSKKEQTVEFQRQIKSKVVAILSLVD